MKVTFSLLLLIAGATALAQDPGAAGTGIEEYLPVFRELSLDASAV